jgi:hypothetical protein
MAASVRMRRFVSDAFADLFDQRSPFGRLAFVHVLMTAGDTLLTVSLAGSLFFSISPDAAKSKVLLYLFLTMAPFAVVAPVLGPLIDRSRGARRAMVVFSGAARAVVCVFMVGQLKTLLLFPLAFVMLVLSKLYLVTKGALVPQLIATGDVAASGDARGEAVADGAGGSGAGTETGVRAPDPSTPAPTGRGGSGDGLAIVNARLGLLASLAGFAASLPAIAVLRLLGAPWVLRLDVVVFIAATVAALRLPVPRASRARGSAVDGRAPAPGAPPAPAPAEPYAPGGEQVVPVASVAGVAIPEGLTRRAARRATLPAVLASGHAVDPEVTLGLSTMSVLRGLVGFLTFMLAFDLRRHGAALAWYGFVLGASVAGSLVGVLLVPRARRLLTEQQMLVLAVWFVATAGFVAAVIGGLAVQAALAFCLGLAAAAAKPAFDALVQRYVPAEAQGRAFARFETRLQLAWVVGSLIPVIAGIPIAPGDLVIAVVAGAAGAFYLTGRRALRGRRPPPRRGEAPGAADQPRRRPSAST